MKMGLHTKGCTFLCCVWAFFPFIFWPEKWPEKWELFCFNFRYHAIKMGKK